MYLTAANLVHYLVERGLAPAEAVIQGDLSIAEAGRRNRNYRVMMRRAAGLFIKQAQKLGPAKSAGLGREALLLGTAQREAGFGDVARWTPPILDFDSRRDTLALALLADAENLRDYCRREGAPPLEPISQAGLALGDAHGPIGLRLAERLAPQLAGAPPWILFFHRLPKNEAARLSGGNRELRRLLRRHAVFADRFDDMAARWSPSTLIHGDVKWDNWLLQMAGDGDRRIYLADWELVDRGDPAWDLGGMLQSFLVFWVEEISRAHNRRERPAATLEELQPPIRAFWRSYRTRRDLSAAQARETINRAIAFSAARLAQTIYEISVNEERLSDFAIHLLQAGQNILEDPQKALAELYGIASEDDDERRPL